MSYAIEDLRPGMSESLTRTVGDEDVTLFAKISGDDNPVHFDEAFAKKTIFRGRVAHGMLPATYISAVLGTRMPGPGTAFLSLTTRFKAPVRIGDAVTATCTVREVSGRRVLFDCVCTVKDKVVLEGEALVVPPAAKP